MSDFPTVPPSQSSDTLINTDAQSSVQLANDVPASVVPIQPEKKKWSRRTRVFIVLLTVLLLGSGSGVAAFIHSTTRLQPSIRLSSEYVRGSIPVGATSTTFHISGQNFSSQSIITFLLDGMIAPGSTSRQSQSNGDVTSTLTVTNAWPIGKHTITARDAGSAVARGVTILIVTPGEDKTPGPNGAPTDSASGTIAATVTLKSSKVKMSLRVSGGMNDGTVCGNEDDGKSHTHSHNASGTNFPFDSTYTETFSATCNGTYRGGHLTYTETITSDTIKDTDGVTCAAKNPYVATHLEGTFTGSTTIIGSSSSDTYTLHCTTPAPIPGQTYGWFFYINGQASDHEDIDISANMGTWTGVAAMQ